mgnify:FL=1
MPPEDRAGHLTWAVRVLSAALLWSCVVLACAASAQEGAAGAAQAGGPVLRTEGPDETVASFLSLRDALEEAVADYLAAPSRDGVARIDDLLAVLRGAIDLEAVPAAGRQRTGNATVLALLDVFGRIDPPAASDLPPGDSFDEGEIAAVRLPGTPLRLVRVETGPRAGEWLFDGMTVIAAPRFLSGIETAPLRSDPPIESWTRALPQLTGPLFPPRLAARLPEGLQALWGGLPIWKAAVLAVAAAVAAGIVLLVHRLAASVAGRAMPGAALVQVATPLLALFLLQVALPRLNRALMPFSQMPDAVAFATTVLSIAALAWLFWSAVQAIVELRIRSRRQAPGLPDLELMRVVGVILGALGVLVIVTAGAQRIGIPIVSLAAGLGIGGLAVALAVRPTLENLVGGLMLYIDKPVRIGDFCTFGPHSGTVERIGIRAVKVRALDRTLISIPNARFADMELVNWAACDMMLIHTTLRLRLETSADQLRYVLAEIRRMLHAHPRIDDDTIRVRYLGPSAAGRDIDLRFYARTREWNEFFAIREDTFLRIDGILEEAGARTAVPAQVLHVGRDAPADAALRDAAEAQVAAWRAAGTLPFPKFSTDELAGLDDTLDYPPAGSPDAGSAEPYRIATPETLSQEPQTEGPQTPQRDR